MMYRETYVRGRLVFRGYVHIERWFVGAPDTAWRARFHWSQR